MLRADSAAILDINNCGDLFSFDPDKAKEEYKQLVKRYHPDISTEDGAEEVFMHINRLYDEAQVLFAKGEWKATNLHVMRSVSGKQIAIHFQSDTAFELGRRYICRDKIWYVFDASCRKYFDNAYNRIRNLHYANERMEEEMSRCMPHMISAFSASDGTFALQLAKPESALALEEVQRRFRGEIPHAHIAWIVSRLCSVCCYLEYCGLSHNGLTVENCFVDPTNHLVMIYGGWGYCIPQGESMLGTVKLVYENMPISVKTSKKGSILTDLESVKQIGLQLAGTQKIPDAFQKWLNTGSSDSTAKEFSKWDETLNRSYGNRRFIDMVFPDADASEN